MKINIKNRLVALITSSAVAFTLVGCSTEKKESNSDNSSMIETSSFSQSLALDEDKCIKNMPITIYDAYFYGDFSIEMLAKYIEENDELPEQIKYTGQLENLKSFVSDYAEYINAYKDGNKELLSRVLERLQTNEIFNIDTYINYFPYLKEQDAVCSNNGVYTIDDEFLLRKGGLTIKDNYSDNIFTYINKYNSIDKFDEEGWANLFSNLIYVLSIDPSEYNFDSAAFLSLMQYDFLSEDAKLVDVLAYTNDNIKSINDYVLNNLKTKIIGKDTDNIILEYNKEDTDWKVICINDDGSYKYMKSASEYIDSYDYKTVSELELISKINELLLQGNSKQALSELNLLFSQLSLDPYFLSSNEENNIKYK